AAPRAETEAGAAAVASTFPAAAVPVAPAPSPTPQAAERPLGERARVLEIGREQRAVDEADDVGGKRVYEHALVGGPRTRLLPPFLGSEELETGDAAGQNPLEQRVDEELPRGVVRV